MAEQIKDPTPQELEWMHSYADLLAAEAFLVKEILDPSNDSDVWNEHVMRVQNAIQGQTLTNGEG